MNLVLCCDAAPQLAILIPQIAIDANNAIEQWPDSQRHPPEQQHSDGVASIAKVEAVCAKCSEEQPQQPCHHSLLAGGFVLLLREHSAGVAYAILRIGSH